MELTTFVRVLCGSTLRKLRQRPKSESLVSGGILCGTTNAAVTDAASVLPPFGAGKYSPFRYFSQMTIEGRKSSRHGRRIQMMLLSCCCNLFRRLGRLVDDPERLMISEYYRAPFTAYKKCSGAVAVFLAGHVQKVYKTVSYDRIVAIARLFTLLKGANENCIRNASLLKKSSRDYHDCRHCLKDKLGAPSERCRFVRNPIHRKLAAKRIGVSEFGLSLR